jgi:flagellar assembly protein FliH
MSSSPEVPVDVDFGQLTPVATPDLAPNLREAALQARQLVAAAEAEAERVRDNARAVGLAEGLAIGKEEAVAQFRPSIGAALEALSAVRALEAGATERVERHAVELALQVAERVVAGAIAVSPERLLDAVRGALRTLVERERVTLLVHPEDLDLMRTAVADVAGSLGGIEHIEVQEERRVGRGGAIVRTSLGEVDASVEAKLARVRSVVEQELGS